MCALPQLELLSFNIEKAPYNRGPQPVDCSRVVGRGLLATGPQGAKQDAVLWGAKTGRRRTLGNKNGMPPHCGTQNRDGDTPWGAKTGRTHAVGRKNRTLQCSATLCENGPTLRLGVKTGCRRGSVCENGPTLHLRAQKHGTVHMNGAGLASITQVLARLRHMRGHGPVRTMLPSPFPSGAPTIKVGDLCLTTPPINTTCRTSTHSAREKFPEEGDSSTSPKARKRKPRIPATDPD